MKILVTGGMGYIGSHTCVQLIEAGYSPIIIDNLSNSNQAVLARIERIAGKQPDFYEGDIRDAAFLRTVFEKENIDAVIHFAGLKAVGESVEQPLKYYENNVYGTVSLATIMAEFNVKTMIFSSSATVYGDPASVPIDESFPLSATNPYGRSKLMVEELLGDLVKSDPDWNITLLRYFNPVGAHASGLIGEDPQGIPNNLMPFIAQVAVGRRDKLSIFGGDYPTVDGTGVRDYIHVVDLADGHLCALDKLNKKTGLHIYNLGTNNGQSVLQMLTAFSKACGKELAYQICERRPGDIAECWASTEKAEADLGWKATHTIEDMVKDTWHWQSNNPEGYNK